MYEGYKAHSEVEMVVMSRYFYYQLANIFVTVMGGSVEKLLKKLNNDPAGVLTILGDALPNV
ncbi:unnamed protein product, partial [Phaeothamnion confervicola]